MSNSHFDAEGFYSALDSERRSRNKTWKEVAKESRISASTLTRMGQGKRPDVDTLAALAKWSGVPVESYYVGKVRKSNSPDILKELPSLLRADRHLTRDDAELIEVILKSAYEKLRLRRDET